MDKSEYQKLMKFINEIDPKAFITVYNVSSMRYQPKHKKQYLSGMQLTVDRFLRLFGSR